MKALSTALNRAIDRLLGPAHKTACRVPATPTTTREPYRTGDALFDAHTAAVCAGDSGMVHDLSTLDLSDLPAFISRANHLAGKS